MNSIYCITFLIILVLSTHSVLSQECVFAGKIVSEYQKKKKKID